MRKYLLGALATTALFAFVVVADAATYTRDLTIGSTGSDVVALQDMLIASGDLVMPAGVSKGYFGALTKSALAKWQAAKGVSPAAGYFGPVTRAKVEGSSSSSNDDSSNGDLSGGDGDFKSFKILGTPSSEDVFEGASTKVFGFEFEANDSDLQVDRIELLASSTSGTVTKPWKVLDEVAIYNGSKKVADIDASDSDNWDETSTGDSYTVKLSGFKSVVKEGDKAKFYVEVTAKDSLDSADLGSWKVSFNGIDAVRALNADGVNVYEGEVVTDTKTFTLKAAEAGDMTISVDTSDDNEDDNVSVDDSNDTTDVFAYLAKVKSKTGTNNVEKVTVTMTGSDTLTDIIDTVYLFIDGDEVGSESAAASVVFDNLDIDIDEGDKIDFEVRYDINDTNDGARFVNGATTTVTGMTVNYVDSNDDDKTASTDVDGGIMTYSTSSVSVKVASKPAAVSPVSLDESKGRVYVAFDVTAPEDDDIYIPKGATTSTAVASGKGAVFAVVDANGSSATATTTAANSFLTLSSGGSESGDYWKVSAGNTGKFTMEVVLDNLGGAAAQTIGVELNGVNYKLNSADTADTQFTSGLDEAYRSSTVYLLTTNPAN
jgi:hypothetical protein